MHDSHAHIISDNLAKYPAANPDDPKVVEVLNDPFPAERLIDEMTSCGVSKALVVQRGQIYGFDNSYVIDAAKASNGKLKAVCNVDISQNACGDEVTKLHGSGAAGFRLMANIQDKTFNWLDGPNAPAFWSSVSDLCVPVCVHFFVWNRDEGLTRLETLLDKYPVTQLVIDHLTNGPIGNEVDSGIDDLVRRMGDRANVSLKFTSIPLNSLAERQLDASRVLDAYLAIFSADRLLWGSDVTQSKGSYAEMVARGRQAVERFPQDIQTKLLEANVARIYNL